MKPERKSHIEKILREYLSPTSSISIQSFDSIISIISYCSQVIWWLKGLLRFLIARQTKQRCKQSPFFTLTRREIAACQWILFYIKEWSGRTPINRTVWLHTDLHIIADAGYKVYTHGGEVWGMGAHCLETGAYICEPWNPKILEQSKAKKSGNVSVPFLESTCILIAVLTLGRDNTNILVHTDSKAAANICSGRWSKTNQFLNDYIAYFDFECATRRVLMQVEAVPRKLIPGAHLLSQGDVSKAQRYAQLQCRVIGRRLQPLLLTK